MIIKLNRRVKYTRKLQWKHLLKGRRRVSKSRPLAQWMKLDLTNCCCLRLFCQSTDFVQVQCLLKQVANVKTHAMIGNIELNFLFIYLFLLTDDRLVKVNFDFLFPKSFLKNILQKVTQLIVPKCRELRKLQSEKICL